MKSLIWKVIFLSVVCLGVLFIVYTSVGRLTGKSGGDSTSSTNLADRIVNKLRPSQPPEVLIDDDKESQSVSIDDSKTSQSANRSTPAKTPKVPDKPYWVQKQTYWDGKIQMTRYTIHNHTCRKYYKVTAGFGPYDERELEQFIKRQEGNSRVVWNECPKICGGKSIP